MNKIIKYILATLIATTITTYLLMSFAFVDDKKDALLCKNIKITIDADEKSSFIDANSIRTVLLNCGEKIIDERLDKVNTYKLKQILSKNHAIKSINVFTTIDANLNVEIKQRRPIIRIQCENFCCYIDDAGYIFPLSPKADLYIPIVTGTIFPAPRAGFVGYIPKNGTGDILNQLYEFAVFLKDDVFWNNMIEQINITNNKIEIVPQIADHIVKLGKLENFKSKLKKLRKFYKNGLPAIGWNKYKTIDIEYRKLIICKK
jgi:cell division protein FtsQ